MKKIIFLFLICVNAFAVDCELINTSHFGKKGISNNIQMIFRDIDVSKNMISEYQISEKAKLQLKYITKFDPITGLDFVVGLLELLIHKGGNGYTVQSSSSSMKNNFVDDKVIFNLSYIFGNRSESLDYQLSERIVFQDYILECTIL